MQQTATGLSSSLTPGDHRAMQEFRPVLRRHHGRQTIATDYEFSPEVVEIFACGRDEAAFILWREGDGIAALEMRERDSRWLGVTSMAECLQRIGCALAASR